MRPILLHGHTRSLTKIKYNVEGDLLFSCSKDNKPSVWFSHNGERLGTFNGHTGTVWDLDVSYDSTRLVTGSADSSMILWNVYTGESLYIWKMKTAVRSVAFSEGDKMVLMITDATMGQVSTMRIYDIGKLTNEPLDTIVMPASKATIARWGALNKVIYTGHEDGTIIMWDALTGDVIKTVRHHTGQIQDLQFSKDKSYFITASKDHYSKVIDAKTLDVLKVFMTERPVNSASLSPLRHHIMLGGGQEAMSVTTTSVKQGKFEVRFFHKVFGEEIGRVKGHFGPINTLAFHPDGRSFASGGEDGYIRVHHFDDDYFNFKYEEEDFDLI